MEALTFQRGVSHAGGRLDLYRRPVDGAAPPTLLLEWGRANGPVDWSPDGRHLAFTSDESGRSEVYVQAIEGTRLVGGRVQVSSAGGTEPAWRRDGGELYYAGGGHLVAVPVTRDGDAIRTGTPMPLFATTLAGGSYGTATYAPSSDGRRFVIITPVDGSEAAPATVVLNWRRDEQP